MMNVIVPKLEYAEVREGNSMLAKKLGTISMTAAKKILSVRKRRVIYSIESRIRDVRT